MATTVPGLVSVILPNRNHAHFLPTALDALLAQTWLHLEILLVDDASSDNSREVMRSYAARDPRVRPIELAEHTGINRAVELVRSQARGEYFYVAAADDFVAPKFFETSVGMLQQYRSAGLCFSDPTEFYEADNRTIRFPLYLSNDPVHYDPSEFQLVLTRNYFHISPNTAIYRADMFQDAGGYRAELGWLSDWFVTLVVALRNGACYVPESLTFLRLRNDSFSAMTARDTRSHRQPFDRFLALLTQPAHADVARAMRRSGMLPEYRFRTLRWLLQSRQGRMFLSSRLVVRIVSRSVWSYLRPRAPYWLRRSLRKYVSCNTKTGDRESERVS